MVTIPSFLLRKLYVRGSLCNTDQGVRFHLLNKLGAGYARRIFPLVMDGQEVPLEHCSFSIEGNQFSFSDVSNERPFTLDLNKTTRYNRKEHNPDQRAPHHCHVLPGSGVGQPGIRFYGRAIRWLVNLTGPL